MTGPVNGTVAVVGAGIGGLAAAVGLHADGWDVTVYERGDQPATTGTGFGIWPEALFALDELGLGSAVRAAGLEQRNGVVRRPDGTRIADIDVEKLRRRTGESVRLVSRRTLLQIMLSALPAGVVHFGAGVSDVWDLAARHDVVVGADGVNSTVRAALFGDRSAPRYAGSTVWRGVAPLTVASGSETWGRGAKFGITPLGPGQTNWYAVVTAPEGHRPGDGGVEELRDRFASWHEPIPAVLDLFDESGVLHHDLYYLDPPLRSFTRANVVLVGDAAHAMTPDLGQGACQALIDGLALARTLAEREVPAALHEYDRRRRRRTQRLVRLARGASRMAQAERTAPVRDLALRAALSAGPPG